MKHILTKLGHLNGETRNNTSLFASLADAVVNVANKNTIGDILKWIDQNRPHYAEAIHDCLRLPDLSKVVQASAGPNKKPERGGSKLKQKPAGQANHKQSGHGKHEKPKPQTGNESQVSIAPQSELQEEDMTTNTDLFMTEHVGLPDNKVIDTTLSERANK